MGYFWPLASYGSGVQEPRQRLSEAGGATGISPCLLRHKLLLEPQFFCSARLALSGKEEEVLATLTLAPIEDASEPSDVAETIQVVG